MSGTPKRDPFRVAAEKIASSRDPLAALLTVPRVPPRRRRRARIVAGAVFVLLVLAVLAVVVAEVGTRTTRESSPRLAQEIQTMRELFARAAGSVSEAEISATMRHLRHDSPEVRRHALIALSHHRIDVHPGLLAWLAHEAGDAPHVPEEVAADTATSTNAVAQLSALRTRRAVARAVWFQAARTKDQRLRDLALEFSKDGDSNVSRSGAAALAALE